MVPHSLLVKVRILGIARAVGHHLREFQHVIGIARLGPIQMVNIPVAVLLGQEVLSHGIATDTDGAVLSHILPEVFGRLDELRIEGRKLGTLHFPYPLHTDVFGNLGIGMFVVQECRIWRLHAVEHRLVGIALSRTKIQFVAKELIGIEQRLVHTSMLTIEEALQIVVRDITYHIDTPVAEFAEHLFGIFVATIYISITQSGKNLMLAIEGDPAPVTTD